MNFRVGVTFAAVIVGGCSSSDGGGELDGALPVNGAECSSLSVVSRSTEDNASESAQVCFNPELLQVGSRHLNYASNNPGCERSAFNYSVDGATRFDGKDAIQTSVDEQIAGSARSETHYAAQDETSRWVRLYGIERSSETESQRSQSRTTFDPYRELRFAMQAGDSYTQSYVESTEAVVTLIDPQVQTPPTTSNNETVVDETVTFIGVEQVQVEAGSFEACRYEIESSRSVNGDDPTIVESTRWFDVDSGVELKRQVQQSGAVLELTNGAEANAVNGETVQ